MIAPPKNRDAVAFRISHFASLESADGRFSP